MKTTISAALGVLICLSSNVSANGPCQMYHEGEVESSCEYQSGPCVCECPYTYYRPVYYYTSRCVQEPFPVCRTCVRYVPRQYEITRCRYVPQYYAEQFCRYEPEYYSIEETRYRSRLVNDLQCGYVPYTYVKRTCTYPGQTNACSDCSSSQQSPTYPSAYYQSSTQKSEGQMQMQAKSNTNSMRDMASNDCCGNGWQTSTWEKTR